MVEDNDKPEKGDSKAEVTKRDSRHLRGTIAETLATDSPNFTKDDTSLLKFHGIYQQDDRDKRHENRKAGKDEEWIFMIRCAIPAGVLTAEQYLNLDRIADDHANGTLRVTTRQGIQFHGVVKRNLKRTIARINEKLITTLSACGDVERNVMACPAPLSDPAHVTLRRIAREIAVQLRPASHAYHEIWLDGEKHLCTEDEEPFYDNAYLPRKFKTGIALADDNCIDVYTQDLGLIAFTDHGRLLGFNILIGGGLGMTHGKEDTEARLGQPLGFIEPENAVEAARTVAAVFRDFGNRADRRHARLKYVIRQRGMDWFRDEFRKRALFTLHAWRPLAPPTFHDHLGPNPQGDHTWFYGVFIENGRVKNNGHMRMKSALRRIVESFRPGITLTPHQNLLLTGLSRESADAVEKTLMEHGVTPATQLSAARRYSMACPALPTCGLAMAESERIMPDVVGRFERLLLELGMRDVPITLRMTGCPNGCARPYTADIAFVGRRPDIYHIYVGGGLPGDRVVDLYAGDVHVNDMIETLRPLLTGWARHRTNGESFSDYYQRLLGSRPPRQGITGREEATRSVLELKILN